MYISAYERHHCERVNALELAWHFAVSKHSLREVRARRRVPGSDARSVINLILQERAVQHFANGDRATYAKWFGMREYFGEMWLTGVAYSSARTDGEIFTVNHVCQQKCAS